MRNNWSRCQWEMKNNRAFFWENLKSLSFHSTSLQQTGLEVTLYTCRRVVWGWISAGVPVMLTGSRSFPQSLYENTKIEPRLGHDFFLPSSFQFITHQSSYNPTLYTVIYTGIVSLNNPQKIILWRMYPLPRNYSVNMFQRIRNNIGRPFLGNGCVFCAVVRPEAV
jgi:hypothetical protein